MRVTQGMLASNSLRNLSNSYTQMGKYQDQLATGKKITKPSDDPVVAMKGMYYRSNLSEVEQYKRNLSEAYLWMENSEAGVEHVNEALQRVRELTVQGSNGTLSDSDKEAIAREIEQIKKEIMNVANTQVAGRYIFNGTNTSKPPVQDGGSGAPQVSLNTSDYSIEVSRGVSLKSNINPDNVFGQKMFDIIQGIQETLSGTGTADLNNLLSDLDTQMDTISAERSELGARYNRLEMIEARIDQQEVISTRILSDNEDADLERVIMDLTNQESVHRAALSVGARIIQPTLMDFLR
ncbi:flagellar hook-associated protein FlgL [Robertmurraya korlensis]|uniref:flagellar hook-associated protein FlgL n=1 Tax=Robertmurraya korlensis TaxID=519977 RepID=UPI00203D7220|nr:flagellar hook-associated protein FlgL [Robertmurraya korlensis]MCM3602654.1 flagellar hook-associated protein FlgL [Robertmurraya korlensis]